jgi:hypothetical protein
MYLQYTKKSNLCWCPIDQEKCDGMIKRKKEEVLLRGFHLHVPCCSFGKCVHLMIRVHIFEAENKCYSINTTIVSQVTTLHNYMHCKMNKMPCPFIYRFVRFSTTSHCIGVTQWCSYKGTSQLWVGLRSLHLAQVLLITRKRFWIYFLVWKINFQLSATLLQKGEQFT